jgi:hypothetical protein
LVGFKNGQALIFARQMGVEITAGDVLVAERRHGPAATGQTGRSDQGQAKAKGRTDKCEMRNHEVPSNLMVTPWPAITAWNRAFGGDFKIIWGGFRAPPAGLAGRRRFS